MTAMLQVMRELSIEIPLVSMHSVSKGFYGECGRRGAYVEMVGLPEAVLGQLSKLASISLCSNISGQITMAVIMNPPKVCMHAACTPYPASSGHCMSCMKGMDVNNRGA